jgi:hypothetical protein
MSTDFFEYREIKLCPSSHLGIDYWGADTSLTRSGKKVGKIMFKLGHPVSDSGI